MQNMGIVDDTTGGVETVGDAAFQSGEQVSTTLLKQGGKGLDGTVDVTSDVLGEAGDLTKNTVKGTANLAGDGVNRIADDAQAVTERGTQTIEKTANGTQEVAENTASGVVDTAKNTADAATDVRTY